MSSPLSVNTKTQIAIVVMLAAALWFGLQTWLNQSAIVASGALAFNTQRYLIAAAVMGIVCWVTRSRLTRRAILSGAAVGFVFAITIAFESQALMVGSAGRTTFLGGLFVVFMPFLASFTRRHQLRAEELVGTGLTLAGAWWLFGTPTGSEGGDGFAVMRAISCAFLLLAIQKCAVEDWRVSCFVNLCVVAAISTVGAVASGQLEFSLQLDVLLPATISAVVGSVICASALLWSGRYLSASLAGVLLFLDSPFTLMWGVLIGKESLTPASLLAYSLIAVGALCVLTAGSPLLHRRRFAMPSNKRITLESAPVGQSS